MSEATGRRVVKKRAVRSTEKPVAKTQPKDEPSPWADALDPGDKIEFGATVETRDKQGRTFWPKANTSVTIRANETHEEAATRAYTVTMAILTDAVTAFMQD